MFHPRLSVLPTLSVLLLTAPASRLAAQTPAAPADVSTIDGIMKATYDVISGPAGEKRDWNRMRSLFAPGARLIPTGKDAEGKPRMRTWTLEEYITAAGPSLEKDGFFEVETGRVLERYGNVVHLMSAYESRHQATDPKPFARGVNSFQLWFDGNRWWVVTIFWQGETPDNPIPGKYLKK